MWPVNLNTEYLCYISIVETCIYACARYSCSECISGGGGLFPPHLPSIIFLLLQLCIVICENEVVLNNVLQTAREIIIR